MGNKVIFSRLLMNIEIAVMQCFKQFLRFFIAEFLSNLSNGKNQRFLKYCQPFNLLLLSLFHPVFCFSLTTALILFCNFRQQ